MQELAKHLFLTVPGTRQARELSHHLNELDLWKSSPQQADFSKPRWLFWVEPSLSGNGGQWRRWGETLEPIQLSIIWHWELYQGLPQPLAQGEITLSL